MNRCPAPSGAFAVFRRPLRLALAGALCAAALLPALAQDTMNLRPFPANAQRGKLLITQPPVVTLDGQSDRLSPGVRIRDTRNMLVLSGTLVGQTLTVNYQREPTGLIHQVWILTEAEASVPLGTPTFGTPFGIAPPQPPRDDGKTPFNQLPVYPQR